MTKTDAEQHAAVWELANKMLNIELQRAMDEKLEALVAATLAVSNLAESMRRSYATMAKAIKE